MQKILDNLRDPSWWFTAFFVSVLVSIMAGFAKDFAERRFNLFLAWTRETRARRRASREAVISAWSSSEGLVAISVLNLIFQTILFVTVATIVHDRLQYLLLRYDVAGVPDVSQMGIRRLAGLVIGLAFVVYSAYEATTQALLTQAVLERFCRTRGIPIAVHYERYRSSPVPASGAGSPNSTPPGVHADPASSSGE